MLPVRRHHPGEAGFSLIELLVALMLVGIVMTALTTFFVSSINGTNNQSNRQTAVQLVNDALERVRALKGSAVTTGRDQASATAQWTSAGSVVSPYLSSMALTYDSTASTGTTAALPTTGQTVTINNVAFNQNWYVGLCWQPLAGGDCTSTQLSTGVAFYRVVALVTWASKGCPGSLCTQLAATLVSSASTEPVFKSNQTATAPQVVNPGRQNGELTVAVDLTITASGGAPPLTWAATGLPTGLAMDSSGRITGTPTTIGTYSVTVTATDGFGLVGSAAFTWVVVALPALTNPGSQTSQGGTAITALTVGLAGGTSPLTWSATGLPTGLAIDTSSGAITGTPTKVGTYSASVTVTDTYSKSATTTFTWTVPALSITTPATQTGEVGVASTALQITASGGLPPYQFTATSLPPGLSISTTGSITGKPTTAGTYSPKVTVTDSTGATATTSAFTWKIVTGPAITFPRGAQTAALGTQFTVSATASGGTGPYTWTAVNVPTGVSMPSNGQFTGPLSAAGRFLTTLTVTDSAGATDSILLPITVTTSTALRITSPTGDRSDTVKQAIAAFTAVAAGETGTKTWTATGLPTGITINTSTGAVSGTPTVAGTYTSRLTVTDGNKATSVFMFSWTIA